MESNLEVLSGILQDRGKLRSNKVIKTAVKVGILTMHGWKLKKQTETTYIATLSIK